MTADIILGQYQLLIEHADRVADQRNIKNKNYLTINTAIITGIGYLVINFGLTEAILLIPVSVVGGVINYIWIYNISQFASALKAIWEQVQEIETELPFKVHTNKWHQLTAQNYRNSSHYEMYTPRLFIIIHIFICISCVTLVSSSYFLNRETWTFIKSLIDMSYL